MWQIVIMMLALLFSLAVSPVHAQDDNPDVIPEPIEMIDEGGYDITNYLLLGSDTFNTQNVGRTDVIVILSVNRTAGTVAMLSLPRDLYVYIPDYQMYRINTAFAYGVRSEHPEGGLGELRDTIRYNLGIEIDHYARVDFTRFRQIVDDLGGVDIAVDCIIEDWRLKEPTLDPSVEENWEQFRLPVGVHQMNGDLALWYARSRMTTSDFDRGRRHQQLLRGIWRRIQSLNLLQQVSDVYPQLLELVETDISLDEMLSLVPIAANLDPQRIASYTLRPNVEVRSWASPEGSSVLAINREALRARIRQFYTPPTALQTREQRPTVEIINATGYADLTQVAAERLAWDGFIPIIGQSAAITTPTTVIYDQAGRTRDSSRALLQRILRVNDQSVVVDPNPNRAADYRIVLGSSYSTCNYNTAEPAPPTTGNA